MERRSIDLRIAGQIYKVVSSAPREELQQLAAVVEAKLSEIGQRGGRTQPQAILLAAMALAHEVEQERGKRDSLERRTRDLLRRVLLRIDDALEPMDVPEEAAPGD